MTMTNERRSDDERIAKLLVLTQQVHSAMFGNGKPGLKAEFDQLKGSLAVWKTIAGSGGLVAGLLLVLEVVKYFKG